MAAALFAVLALPDICNGDDGMKAGDFATYRIVTGKMTVFVRCRMISSVDNKIKIRVDTWYGKKVGEPMSTKDITVASVKKNFLSGIVKDIPEQNFLDVRNDKAVNKGESEKLNISGHNMDCVAYKKGNITNWISAAAPYDGLVKITVGKEVFCELIEFGHN